MHLKAVAFDLGHTLMDEERDADVPLEARALHLMPGAFEAVSQIDLPLAIWANTRVAVEADVRSWLTRARLSERFRWVITSVDAGARKPEPAFFRYALGRCGLGQEDVLFVGNQLNADIAGAARVGIRTVWLSDAAYRSQDDRPCDARPAYTIRTLHELPALIRHVGRGERWIAC